MTGFNNFIPMTISEDDAPKVESHINEFDGVKNFSFSKFLHDKSISSADKIAVVQAGENYSWRDIERGANKIAADLAEKNVRKGSHVAICGANSINWISSLRCSIISGANMTAEQIENLQRLMPNNHFMSSYGLSEMAPVSITEYNDNRENILNTVGKPVKNIKIKILEPDLKGIGEILVQGFNLMAGYYKLAPEEQPFDENGWLHTGDLGAIDENGYLHLTGRIKEIIIRGGENLGRSCLRLCKIKIRRLQRK